MPTATLIEESMSWWQPGTNLYRLSKPLDGHEWIAISVPQNAYDSDATVHPSTAYGASVADHDGNGLVPLRRYPDLTHAETLLAIGYEVTDGTYS
ncbi:hypothetical protein [Rhodococcus sp. 1168]|uniref:DUF7572 family protein n=1 Tax=Rhodococcus sp. 1168 TaxID=2018041 RepID=UPI000A0C6E2C|nr:hypothetical protein [Rhodococcus sp. 1168]ORI13420.1 hypothetical protein BJI47_22515 [Rhodococcus sp. 1168]